MRINVRSQAFNFAGPKKRKTDPRISRVPWHRFSDLFAHLLPQVIVGALFSSTYTRNRTVFRISVQNVFYPLPHQGRHPNAYKAVQTRSGRDLGATFSYSHQPKMPRIPVLRYLLESKNDCSDAERERKKSRR